MSGNGVVGAGPELSRGAKAGAVRDLRHRLALALDFDDSVVAMRWALRLRDHFGVAKVGMELFSAAGPAMVTELLEAGYQVFVDVKLADIPTTTRRAARVLGALGASYMTVHTFAGETVLRAGVEGLAEGAERAGLPAPVALGVTILTSEAAAPADLLSERVLVATRAGCGGVVCGASDLAQVKALAGDLLCVVPGIRLADGYTHDQVRSASPGEAAQAGADLLVIGRAVTGAADPERAAERIAAELGAIR